ncbi:hypothetical protein Bbelb_446220 [Branchiostoma belcheri]|nr:hypothetical protein Bbelb_446220 [Branchiostoma belcheri]
MAKYFTIFSSGDLFCQRGASGRPANSFRVNSSLNCILDPAGSPHRYHFSASGGLGAPNPRGKGQVTLFVLNLHGARASAPIILGTQYPKGLLDSLVFTTELLVSYSPSLSAPCPHCLTPQARGVKTDGTPATLSLSGNYIQE